MQEQIVYITADAKNKIRQTGGEVCGVLIKAEISVGERV